MKTHNIIVYYIIFIIGLLMSFTSCSNEDGFNSATYIASVTAQQHQNNALRVDITIGFRKNCNYFITYWAKDGSTDKKSIKHHSVEDMKSTATLMFLKSNTKYNFYITVVDGSKTTISDTYDFSTSSLSADVPTYNVTLDNTSAPIAGYIMQWQASTPGYITFCDTDGNVVWYQDFEQPIRTAYYSEERGEIAALIGFKAGENSEFQRIGKAIIIIDLYGNVIKRIEADNNSIDEPHHELKILSNGDLLAVHNVIKNYNLTAIGGEDNVPIYGDGFSIISRDGKSNKYWDIFNEIDPLRDNSYLNTLSHVNDLVHANSVNYDSEGNYYMTFNRLNELWKIDGNTGEVIYRVGPNGNIALKSGNFPSGIHCAEVLAPNKVLFFDNGSNIKQSRAVIYDIDPIAKTAETSLSVSIPSEYSSTNRSNVELIDNNTLMFGSTLGRCCVFTNLNGDVLKVIKRSGISYRAHYFYDINY